MTNPLQKWPSHLVIVRHGESARNERKQKAKQSGALFFGGAERDMNEPLTARGVQQAIYTGKAFAERFRFDAAYTSPFLRTKQTIKNILDQFDSPLEIIPEERIREIDFGILDGLMSDGTKLLHPHEAERKKRYGKYWYRPPGGESYPDVGLRLHSFLGTLNREMRGKSVLVVCHSVVVLMFCKLLDRLSEDQVIQMSKGDKDVKNCGVVHYEFDPAAGESGKLVRRFYNEIFYPAEFASTEHSASATAGK